jgi:hypothetical protein
VPSGATAEQAQQQTREAGTAEKMEPGGLANRRSALATSERKAQRRSREAGEAGMDLTGQLADPSSSLRELLKIVITR